MIKMRVLAKRNYFKKSHTEIPELNEWGGGGRGAIEHVYNGAKQMGKRREVS